MLWMTTTSAKARGQVVRIDPVTGRVVMALHLPVAKCYYLTFEAGYLRAVCGETSELTEFLRIDPVTGQVSGRTGPIRGTIGQVAITPAGEWYFTTYTGISGLVGQGRRAHVVTVHDPSYPVSFAYTQSLVYSQGALWALTNDESVAKIDPATGRVESVYTYGSYDPSYNGGLDFLAVGQGSPWFLDDGFPLSGLLRVSIATGRPLGGVRIRPGSCDQPCGQIYVTQNAVWVPTSNTLIRIDPAGLPS